MDGVYRVLVVDDDPIGRQAISKLLRSAGYELFQAPTGEEGLLLARQEKPDIILLDVVLPDISGIEVCRRIKEDPELADTFVAMLSAYKIASDHQAQGLEGGADDYIARPVGNREFLARVQAVLRIREAQQQLKRRERQQSALAELGYQALVVDDLALFENQCASLVAELLQVDWCAIYKPVRGGAALMLQTGGGWPEGVFEKTNFDATADHPANFIFHSAQPVVVKDLREEERFKNDPLVAKHSLRSCLGLRLCTGREALGVLAVYSASLRTFSENELDLLQSVANILASAILRKRAEDEPIKAGKFEAMGFLAGGLAHDFNNMLAIVVGNLDLVRLSVEAGSSALTPLGEAARATMKASELSNKFLTFATGGSPIKKAVLLEDLVTNAVESVLQGSPIRCEYSFPQDPAWTGLVEVDPTQFAQALHHIVVNAVEAMPQGGLINVTVERPSPDAGIIRTETPPDFAFVKISIKDQGKGIPQKDMGRIFDPYYSTKTRGVEKGMGLGLSIAYSIIKRHGGELKVESEEGVGTICHIYLPVADTQEKGETAPGSTAPVKRGSILVMDDEDMLREMLEQLLTRIGFKEVVLVKDGREAIAFFLSAREAGKPFDIVMLDLTIKEGMGGVETIQVLREIDPSVKAILCSGYSNDPIMSDFRAHGFVGALVKPFRMQQLRDALAEAGCR
jgi:DNA-binding response OmpR family regulator/signal transduction histidine kinase